MRRETKVIRFLNKWWPALFVLTYAIIVLFGVASATDKAAAVDTCDNIVPACSLVANAEVLGGSDKYEPIATKPSLGNYRTFSYEVISWGAVTTDVDTFASLAAATMADARGWAQAGLSFNKVASGGDFSLVLSDAATVGTVAGCSSDWSCRSGRYVIINEDRWTGATTSWNNDDGSLRDYQHMVINHELGHWLGHGHSSCSGAGNLAYVMQQQSIELGGCKHNPWPLLVEINALQ